MDTKRTMHDDNIVSDIPWRPMYYFMVLRTSKYDKEGTLPVIRHAGPIPALAYVYYLDDIKNDVGTIREQVYRYHVQDSFGQDAFAFCEKKYGEYLQSTDYKEKAVT